MKIEIDADSHVTIHQLDDKKIDHLITLAERILKMQDETRKQLDRINTTTNNIGSEVSAIAQKLTDAAAHVEDPAIAAQLKDSADRLDAASTQLTQLASPTDPAVPTA